MTSKEKCALVAGRDIIPNVGLGEFVEGYTNKKDSFPYYILWWFLFPIVGQILVPLIILFYYLQRLFGTKHVVYIYEKGFFWRRKSLFDQKDSLLRFDEIGGIRTSKTRNYNSTYGIKTYNGTTVILDICDKKGNSLFLQEFSYRNEHEEELKYNALGYVMNAILNIWNVYAFNRFNRELSEKGFCIFYTISRKVKEALELGNGYIKYGGNYAGMGLKYAFQDGLLYIYPSLEDRNFSNKNEYFIINVNDMYDKSIFLYAAQHLLGIK